MNNDFSFLFYYEWIKVLRILPPNEAIEVLEAMVKFAMDREEPKFTNMAQEIAFSPMKNKIEQDKQKREITILKKQNAGRKGGLTKQANARNAKQSLANQGDKDLVLEEDLVLNTSPLTPQGGTEPLKESYPEGFEDFWEMYPRKEAKKDALKAFQKLKPDSALIEKMLAALDQQKKSEAWKKDGGQYIPLPASWIRGERWEDEIKKPQEEGRRWKILL